MNTAIIKLISIAALFAAAFMMSYILADDICHKFVIYSI